MRPPKALVRLDRWVIWRREDDKKKVPYQARHPQRRASTANAATWATYEEAQEAAPEGGVRVGGIGFVIGHGIGAFDLDDCRTKLGELDDWAADLMAKANSYTEVTPSRTGLRIIGLADGDNVNTVRRMPTGKLEIYRGDCGRYITITGYRLNGVGLRNIDSLIDAHGLQDVATMTPDDRKVAEWLGTTCELWLASLRSIDPQRVVNKYHVDSTLTDTAVQGQRSDVIWKLALTLRGAGASKDEVGACLYSSLAWRRKHGAASARALAKEVWRAFNK